MARGWYRTKTVDATVSAQLSEGIAAGVGTTDLFSQVIRLISADPQADLQELSAAGLAADQADAIQHAVKAAVNRKLQIAVASQFSAGDSRVASFLYELLPASLTDESRNAVDQALRGDLSALHGPRPSPASPACAAFGRIYKRPAWNWT